MADTTIKIKYKDYNCGINITKYAKPKDRIAIQLYDLEDGCPISTATVNMPEIDVPANHVLIKSYSENEGMYHALLTQGIIKPMITQYRAGYEMVQLCELAI